jgi:hypothetical protein
VTGRSVCVMRSADWVDVANDDRPERRDGMAKSELYEKGIALRTQLLGEEFVNTMNQDT